MSNILRFHHCTQKVWCLLNCNITIYGTFVFIFSPFLHEDFPCRLKQKTMLM